MGKVTKDKSIAHPESSNYTPCIKEQRALAEFNHRSEAASHAPRLKVTNSETGREISLDHPDDSIAGRLLRKALGSVSGDFMEGILTQVSKAISCDEKKLNFVIDVVKGIKPNDQVESMLATQMAMTQMAFMTLADRLARVENIAEQDSAVSAFNKLARTYTAQMEALKRYRTGGEQKVTVQHVSVNDGGQAIVGGVVQTRRPGDRQLPPNAKEAPTDARRPPMRLLGDIKDQAANQTDDK
jgi:hypothetical protein